MKTKDFECYLCFYNWNFKQFLLNEVIISGYTTREVNRSFINLLHINSLPSNIYSHLDYLTADVIYNILEVEIGYDWICTMV